MTDGAGRFTTIGMKRFSDYRPSQAMIEALRNVRAARQRLKEERLARNAIPDTRQPVARTEGGDTTPEGGQEQAGKSRCGKENGE